MLQRSGEALYSSCAGDKPRTCSATICVVISTCTSKCSRSSCVMGAANNGAANKQIVRVRIVQARNIQVRSFLIAKGMVRRPFLEIRDLDDRRRGRSPDGAPAKQYGVLAPSSRFLAALPELVLFFGAGERQLLDC